MPSSLVPALVSSSTTQRVPPVSIAPPLELPQLELSPSVASIYSPPVVAFVVVPAHYIAAPRHKSLDLPTQIVVCDTSRTILNTSVDCRAVPLFTLKKSIALAFLFKAGAPVCQSFDEIIGHLARNLHRYFVVLFDRSTLFKTLRFELHPDKVFDVGTSLLLRNDALRKSGSCWSQSRRRCVPLAAIWEPILHCAVPADPVNVGRGLLELYGRVRVQFPTFLPPDASTFKPIASWLSSAARLFSLESSFYAEAVGDRSVAPKILRSLNPVPELPSLARPRHFASCASRCR